ncbi:hypothetical protein ACFXPY_45865 [Streptomyces sp. NPDC059153]|uniref:hypothetical protein n=1 Tax=Streptomyces sp. NPDC059153 TaxID=3346743 RepID=UPI0036B11BCD
MSRPYATDEQYERWFLAECCRCGRRKHKAGTWPDGYVCRTCWDGAVRTRGICPGCGQDRALPGLRPGDGAAICTTCAGFSQTLDCSRCGFERKGNASERLRQLGLGQIPLTHDAFHGPKPWRSAAHLEELLMASGILPAVDKYICSVQRWLPDHLVDIADPQHAKTIRFFATWRVLPRLRAQADRGHITPSIRQFAAEQIKYATAFLQWLSKRNTTLASCSQIDIDAWWAENSEHGRNCLRAFLNWAMQGSRCRRLLSIPAMKATRRAALSEDERLDVLGRLLTGPDTPRNLRVAGVIVLLYAQPLTRIVRLTVDDVVHDGEAVLLRLGEPASPVPEPAASLLLDYIADRDNMNTATNQASPWLFPGRRAGQPARPDHLSALLGEIGIPIAAARGAAIRQQLLELPPVVADALGYHDKTTSRLLRETGGTWSRYVAGDHTRSPAGWIPRGTGESRTRKPTSTNIKVRPMELTTTAR